MGLAVCTMIGTEGTTAEARAAGRTNPPVLAGVVAPEGLGAAAVDCIMQFIVKQTDQGFKRLLAGKVDHLGVQVSADDCNVTISVETRRKLGLFEDIHEREVVVT